MRKIQISIFIICLLILGCRNNSFKHGAEPDGFRGIKWGTDISTIKNMEYIKSKDTLLGEVEDIYKQSGDELIIGDAKIESIEYSFWNNKFFEVNIFVIGYENCEALRHSVFEKFGEVSKIKAGTKILSDTYEWAGGITRINLSSGKVCSLSMYSDEIMFTMVEAGRQRIKDKAKEGAEKGF